MGITTRKAVTVEIGCNHCEAKDSKTNPTKKPSMEHFKRIGWKVTDTDVICPYCRQHATFV